MSTTIMESLTCNIFIVSKNIAKLKFLPNTDYYIPTIFMRVNNILREKPKSGRHVLPTKWGWQQSERLVEFEQNLPNKQWRFFTYDKKY